MNRASNNGFTLAEVLITLGIIGIVAAMTIPVLMQKTTAAQKVTALKETFSILSQAHTQAVSDNGSPETWDISTLGTDTGALNTLAIYTPYLKLTKDCGLGAGCWAPGTYSLDAPGRAKALLNNGVSIGTYSYGSGCTNNQGTTSALQNICAIFYIDVNGAKLPNLVGDDVFVFWITKYGIVPRGTVNDTVFNFVSCQSAQGHDSGCTAWALYKENEDYLKCPASLSWNGQTTCP